MASKATRPFTGPEERWPEGKETPVAAADRRRATAGGSEWMSPSGTRLGPGLFNPLVGRRGLSLRPARRRRDVPDRHRDDPFRVHDGERVVGRVPEEPGDGVLVPL